jgi:hypothetical protein
VRQNVDNLAFALVAPLGAYDYCCLAALHWKCTLLARNDFSQTKNSLLQNDSGKSGTGKFLLPIDFIKVAAVAGETPTSGSGAI